MLEDWEHGLLHWTRTGWENSLNTNWIKAGLLARVILILCHYRRYSSSLYITLTQGSADLRSFPFYFLFPDIYSGFDEYILNIHSKELCVMFQQIPKMYAIQIQPPSVQPVSPQSLQVTVLNSGQFVFNFHIWEKICNICVSVFWLFHWMFML